jgi:hypothetical protein
MVVSFEEFRFAEYTGDGHVTPTGRVTEWQRVPKDRDFTASLLEAQKRPLNVTMQDLELRVVTSSFGHAI